MNKPHKNAKEIKHMTFKATSFKITADEGGEGIIEAYVSIFGNTDSYNEVVDKGAFVDSLARKLPKGVWAHDWNQPIAVTLEAKEDDKGLYIKGQLVKGVQRADEAYLLMKAGAIDEFSIGYTVSSDEIDAQGVRHLKKVNLYEWSPVLVGANSETELVGLKGQDGEGEGKDDEDEEGDDAEDADEIEEGEDEEEQDADADEAGADEQQPQGDGTQEGTEGDEGKGLKAGAELSAENRTLIEGVVDALDDLGKAIKTARAPLKSLLDKTSKGQKVDNGESLNAVKVLRIRQVAKGLDRSAEKIIRILKNN